MEDTGLQPERLGGGHVAENGQQKKGWGGRGQLFGIQETEVMAVWRKRLPAADHWAGLVSVSKPVAGESLLGGQVEIRETKMAREEKD